MKNHFFPILIISIFLMITQNIHAQEVVASAGNNHETGEMSISWTLGETVIETYSSADMILTQGFQQPVIVVSTMTEEPDLEFQFTAFPNPTSADVTISTNTGQTQSLKYRIYDVQGRLVSSNNLLGTETRVAFDDLQPGTYFLKITRNEKPVKTFKIMKQ